MTSSPDYLQFILDQLSELPEISYRKMMWEYILYFHSKIIGWIYDNRLLLKPTEKVKNLIIIDYLKQNLYFIHLKIVDYLSKI